MCFSNFLACLCSHSCKVLQTLVIVCIHNSSLLFLKAESEVKQLHLEAYKWKQHFCSWKSFGTEVDVITVHVNRHKHAFCAKQEHTVHWCYAFLERRMFFFVCYTHALYHSVNGRLKMCLWNADELKKQFLKFWNLMFPDKRKWKKNADYSEIHISVMLKKLFSRFFFIFAMLKKCSLMLK